MIYHRMKRQSEMMYWEQCGYIVTFSMQRETDRKMENNQCWIKLQNKSTHNAVHCIKVYEAEVHFVTWQLSSVIQAQDDLVS